MQQIFDFWLANASNVSFRLLTVLNQVFSSFSLGGISGSLFDLEFQNTVGFDSEIEAHSYESSEMLTPLKI